jgi:hypothetical protein
MAAPRKTNTNNDNVSSIGPQDFDLSEMIAQRAEALGVDDGDKFYFTFEGTRFAMVHPSFSEDGWTEEMNSIVQDGDPAEIGNFLLGDRYPEFLALGGKGIYLATLVGKLMRDMEAVDTEGKGSQPNRSLRRAQRRLR